MPSNKPSLYGISKKNSSRYGKALWGKNQFNSTFPLSLCLYMRNSEIKPVCVINRDVEIKATEEFWSFEEIVGRKNEKCYFHFEKKFDPFIKCSRNSVDKIDLVLAIGDIHVAPYEVKLTVVPDSNTAKSDQSDWAPELVVRPVSSAHAMMSVARTLCMDCNSQLKSKVVNILRKAYNQVSDWNNLTEIEKNAFNLVGALSYALKLSENAQKPFLIQPIWRTLGQSFVLSSNCFDVFVWSDIAVMRIPIDQCRQENGVSRSMREVARHVRALYDLLVSGDYDYNSIYKGMPLGYQTDKSFALSGNKTIKYLRHSRLRRPALSADVLNELVTDGGSEELKPERRFDAAVVAHLSTKKNLP